MRRCVFLDRDGVINYKAAEGEYIVRWEDFRLIPTIVDWIRLFKTLGYLVVVVTNQRCIDLGLISSGEMDELHRRMKDLLLEHGATIDAVYCCPHGIDQCNCRKPKPGMVLEAAKEWDIDLSSSIMIGDSKLDRDLAKNCGLAFVAVADGKIVESV
jgi:D-glycero-D-manno-heptose 1,7-bisphosphate phosphatase